MLFGNTLVSERIPKESSQVFKTLLYRNALYIKLVKHLNVRNKLR